MEMTNINKKITAMDNTKAMYDDVCKSLLKDKQIMARILKACVEEFSDCQLDDIIKYAFVGEVHVGSYPVDRDAVAPEVANEDTEDSVLNEGLIRYDLRFTVIVPNSEEQVSLIINIEAQNDHYPGYDLVTRAIYYCSRMIASQKNSVFFSDDYHKIRKVYSIWLCMNPPEKEKNSITKYDITERVVKGNVIRQKKSFDLLSVVMLYLGEAYRENYDDIIGLLSTLLSDKMPKDEKQDVLKNKYDIEMTKELERSVSDMCNLSKGVEERGIQIGMQQGEQKGVLKSIINLMDSLNFSIEQAMTALKISDDEKPEYEELLRKGQ